jgi:hypothetical protein
MTALDGSGLGALKDLHDELDATGRTLIRGRASSRHC